MSVVPFHSAALLLTVGAATTAHAQDDSLLDTLLENEVISAEQHAELSGDGSGTSVEIGPGGLEAVSADGRYALEIGGRLHVDWARHFDDDEPAAAIDGTEVRRARIAIGGRFDESWRFNGQVDFAGGSEIKDFWLRYDGFEHAAVTVGHQKQPYSLALEMSSNDIPFVERGIDNALIDPFVDRAIGVRVDASRGRWFAAAGVYGESTGSGDEGWGSAGRLVFAPVATQERVVHVGVRAAYREPDAAADTIRIRDETTHFSSLHVVDTGLLTGIEDVTLAGPEGALVLGPFSLFGEHTRANVARGGPDLDFRAWHLGATWTLGGESRAATYSRESGELKALHPARSFRDGRGGTWELAARYASLDLNDGALVGGSEKRFTLGASWYANRNVRVLMDWSRIVDTDASSAVRAAAEGTDLVTLRTQLAF